MKRLETVIANGIDWWLRAEAAESAGSRNKIWDDHTMVRESYGKAHAENADALKTDSHYSRFNLLMQQYPELYAHEFFAGKVVHHALMFVSGNFRTQCHLQSSTQSDYEMQRFGRNQEYSGATGIDLLAAVSRGIAAFKQQDACQVATLSAAINQNIYDTHQQIFDWHAVHPGRAGEALELSELPVTAALRCQELGVQLAAGHIIASAYMRGGDIGRVAVLEPKSITDVVEQPLYPFQY